jgi:hypothetical protein
MHRLRQAKRGASSSLSVLHGDEIVLLTKERNEVKPKRGRGGMPRRSRPAPATAIAV